MSIVLEAALSAFFDVLFDKLSSPDLLKIFRQENVAADLRKWTITLPSIRAVLTDAEEKQMTDGFVKSWLAELEDLAYDADDILDEFATEALRRKVNAEEPSTSKIRKFIPACCVGFNPSSIKFDVCMRSKIEGINARLQEIVTLKEGLKLQEIVTLKEGLKLQDCAGKRTATTSLAESHTYGRDEDKEKIVKFLLESSDAQLSVIPIVGMGGLGKTTLAQLVYKDDEVSRYFDLKAWVCVSEDFDNFRLTKEILHSFTSEPLDNNSTLDSLQVKLKEKLSGKKFLLILDDVWNENYDLWTELSKPFKFGAQGSKIVVTTRNDGVSSMMGINSPYKLGELSRDACLRVFTHHALDATDFSKYPELEEFGQKIVDRCKGAPLAAKALGGLLRTKRNPHEWEDVSNRKICAIPEDKSSILSVLKLSYNYLPSHLKRCFAYCSLFPKDNEFDEKDLVLLWMAEGLVQETEGKKPMEDLGGDYFRDLLDRSFFQQSSINESLFVMHDLMNDLAMWAAGDLCCRMEDQLGGSKQFEISTKVRHFSYIEHSNDCIQKFDEDVHLRTFLSLPLYNQYGLTNFDVKYCLFPQLRCLRVLSLSGEDIFELPSSIGDLKYLRYLNLSYTEITILPESTSSLYNLQTLILKGCFNLKELPEKIENLVNLRHLNITNANSIKEMPAGIAKLKSLRTLCFDTMHEWQDWILCRVECEDFLFLRELSIFDCPKLEGKFSHNLPSLEKLFIYACEQLVFSIPSLSKFKEIKIMGCKEVVHGSVKVEKLIIKNCKKLTSLCEDGLMSFATLEIEIESCQSLVNIKLKSTLRTLTIKLCNALESLQYVMDEGGASSTSSLLMNEENLSCIGNNNASLLEHLEISYCQSLKCVSTIVDLAAMLEHLDIKECANLTSLSSKDTLPTTLKVLSLDDCPKLKSIVDKLDKDTLLERLLIYRCEKLRCLPRGLHELCHLKEIDIYKCNSLISLGDLLPTNLRSLAIEHCEKLEALPNNIHNLNFLQDLEIHDCPSIVSFPEEGFPTDLRELELHELCHLRKINICRCNSLISLGDLLPTNLTSLEIRNCEKLEALPNNIHNLNFLQDLEIHDCPSIVSFPEEGFPTDLRELELHELCHLRKINIYRCNSLISLGDLLPTNLTSLEIRNCEKLEALPNNIHNLNFLQDLVIRDCPSIVSFPEEGFPTDLRELELHELCHLKKIDIHECNSLVSLGDLLTTNLRSLEIEDCEKLEALPNNIHNLNFLQDLSICYCPSIVSFPEEGFPTNLRQLWLSGANLCKQVFELGLDRLTSLTSLGIADGIMDSFPEEEDGKTMLMLPTSLTTLSFKYFPNLLFLSWKFFQNLSALEEIYIWDCPKLASLSEKCFPPSLQVLRISSCPVLKQNCEKDKGIMWSKIANIPSVKIDGVEQQK